MNKVIVVRDQALDRLIELAATENRPVVITVKDGRAEVGMLNSADLEPKDYTEKPILLSYFRDFVGSISNALTPLVLVRTQASQHTKNSIIIGFFCF
jgi:hypothetical protein